MRDIPIDNVLPPGATLQDGSLSSIRAKLQNRE